MLNSDAPSKSRRKSQPIPSTEAQMEHGHRSVNRSGELISFSRQRLRRVMDQLVGADEDLRPRLAPSCMGRTPGTRSDMYKQGSILCPEMTAAATVQSKQQQAPVKLDPSKDEPLSM